MYKRGRRKDDAQSEAWGESRGIGKYSLIKCKVIYEPKNQVQFSERGGRGKSRDFKRLVAFSEGR